MTSSSSTSPRAVITDPASSHEAKVRALSVLEKDQSEAAWRVVSTLIPRSDETLRPAMVKALRRMKATESALAVIAADVAKSKHGAEIWRDAIRVLRVMKPKTGSLHNAFAHEDPVVRQEAGVLAILCPHLVDEGTLIHALNDADNSVRDFVVQALRARKTTDGSNSTIKSALQARLRIEEDPVVRGDLEMALQ